MKKLASALLLLLACQVLGNAAVCAADGPTAPALRQIDNSLGMHLAWIPAGEFLMGSNETMEQLLQAFPQYQVEAKTDYLFADEHPQHRVRITHPFYLGRCEVTVKQFRAFADSGYRTEADSAGTGGWGYNPVSGLCEGRDPPIQSAQSGFAAKRRASGGQRDLGDAVAFCRWLSGREGENLSPADRGRVGIRLPCRHDHALRRRRRSPSAGRKRM